MPVVLWTLIEVPIMVGDVETGTQQLWRPYVANRHGQIGDYQSSERMTFLVMVPPSEDWQRVGVVALEAWLQDRAALETAKRQAAESETPPIPTAN